MSFFALKTIALLSMLWDHVTYVWPTSLVLWDLFCPDAPELPQFISLLDILLVYLGRIAAPIFLFSIANGYRHTHDLKKYALRLLIFACLAEYPYCLLFEMHGNILFTLLAGLLTLGLMDRGNRARPGLGYLLAAVVAAAAEYLSVFEGGGRYILFILVFYLTDRWPAPKKALLWLILMPLSRYRLARMIFSEQLFTYWWFHLWCVNALGPVLGALLTLRYNGERGRTFPGDKYLWYIFYPAHLMILGLLNR